VGLPGERCFAEFEIPDRPLEPFPETLGELDPSFLKGHYHFPNTDGRQERSVVETRQFPRYVRCGFFRWGVKPSPNGSVERSVIWISSPALAPAPPPGLKPLPYQVFRAARQVAWNFEMAISSMYLCSYEQLTSTPPFPTAAIAINVPCPAGLYRLEGLASTNTAQAAGKELVSKPSPIATSQDSYRANTSPCP
jgi:hypothetical protein